MMMKAVSIGPVAAAHCAQQAAWRVQARFARSVHLVCDDSIICIVAESLGNGPHNLIVSQAALNLFSAETKVHSEKSALISSNGAVLSLHDCKAWSPKPLELPFAIDRRAVDFALSLARSVAPSESFIHAFPNMAGQNTVLQRAASIRIAKLFEWLRDPHGDAPVSGLIGLGSGLTPSGDDCLGGILLLIDLWPHDVRSALRVQIKNAAAHGTNLLSRNFLAAAAAGFAHEWVLQLRDALCGGVLADIEFALHRMSDIGHSSGWDTAAGMILALAAHADRAAVSAKAAA